MSKECIFGNRLLTPELSYAPSTTKNQHFVGQNLVRAQVKEYLIAASLSKTPA